MNDAPKTVTVKTENGPVIYRESDYDPAIHELWIDAEAPQTGSTADGSEVTSESGEGAGDIPAEFVGVSKTGSKYYIVDIRNAAPLMKKGYGSEEDARTAWNAK